MKPAATRLAICSVSERSQCRSEQMQRIFHIDVKVCSINNTINKNNKTENDNIYFERKENELNGIRRN